MKLAGVVGVNDKYPVLGRNVAMRPRIVVHQTVFERAIIGQVFCRVPEPGRKRHKSAIDW